MPTGPEQPSVTTGLRDWLVRAGRRLRALSQLAAARREFSRLDAAALRDLGIGSAELSSYWAEASGIAERTRRRLSEAAQSLGASRVQAFGGIFLPLAAPGIVAVLLMSFALSASAFSVPVIIGRGLVPTLTPLIYQRFS